MSPNGFQEDFFDEQLPEQKGRKPPFFGKYSDQRFSPQLSIPIEYAAVIAIGVLIAIIVAYAIGVEKGKNMAFGPATGPWGRSVTEDETKPLLDVEMVEKQAEQMMKEAERVETDVAVPEQHLKDAQGAVPAAATRPSDGTVYMLQLASTKNEVYANEEVKKLKGKGFEALVSRKGDWYKIYIPYGTMDEADKAKKKLVPDYKDCLIVKSKQ